MLGIYFGVFVAASLCSAAALVFLILIAGRLRPNSFWALLIEVVRDGSPIRLVYRGELRFEPTFSKVNPS